MGFGKVGHAIAERRCGFRCRISAHDISGQDIPPHLDGRIVLTGLGELLASSDFIVLALPLMPSTMHLIDARAIAAMRPGALLINPARGSLVDEAAVAEAIADGHLGGYAADVFECEDWARADRPRSIDARLVAGAGQTVLTPHIGSAVIGARREIEASAARSIIQALRGEAPSGAINIPKENSCRTLVLQN